jgi:porphobilinogen deaminase/siroheme synthase/uroporphyrinogen-III synthase
MNLVFNIATRDSRLARVQSQEAVDLLSPLFPDGTKFEFVFLQSPGDRDQQTSLADPSVPDDFFTRDTDTALRDGRADFAIHSAKDLPKSMPDDLAVAALLPAKDIRDALVFRKDLITEGRDGATPMAWQAPPSPRSERGPSDISSRPGPRRSAGPTLEDRIKVIGTSSPKREQEIRNLYPDATLKPLRGTIDQRIEKLDHGDYDAIIVAACALERLGMAERIGTYLPYDPVPQQGRLAIIVRRDATELLEVLKKADVRRNAGLVALVGCPADASLLPVRTEQYLKHADVIFHDRLIPDSILLNIHGNAIAVGKAGGHPSISQSEINRQMLREAEQGKLVVRLHGGDPGIYGHLGEELEFLTAWNIRVDVVPAVTAAQIAAARAHTPLTHRGDGHSVTIISGRLNTVPPPDTGNLAIYMGVAEMKKLAGQLLAAGWPAETPVIAAERLGYRDERLTRSDLGHVKSLELETPAVFLVGTRAFPETPYTLFVGTDPEHFIQHGPLIHWPLIKLVSRPIKERVAELKKHLDDVRGIIFPSRFAVECFVEALMSWSDVRALNGKLLLAVGPATEEQLARFGLRADGATDTYGGVHALAKKLTKDFAGKYLYPCSDASPVDQRVADLKTHGIDLVPAHFYMNRETPYAELPRLPFSRVLFTSTSTVKAYFAAHPDELKANRTWLAVGPSTLKGLQALGLAGETIAAP